MHEKSISCRRAADGSRVELDMACIVGFTASDNSTLIIVQGEDGAVQTIDVQESPEELAILMNEAEALAAGECIYSQSIRSRTEQ